MRTKKTTKTIELTVERSEVFVVRPPRSVFAWCDGCSAEARLVVPEEAAVLLQTNTRALYRLIEAGALHFTESPAGVLYVCLNSLIGSGSAVREVETAADERG